MQAYFLFFIVASGELQMVVIIVVVVSFLSAVQESVCCWYCVDVIGCFCTSESVEGCTFWFWRILLNLHVAMAVSVCN